MKERVMCGPTPDVGPLARRNKAVHVAFRPVEPLLEDRLHDMFTHIRSSRTIGDATLSMAIRCIDGFYITSKGCNPLKEDPRLVRVIGYDPVQDVSLIAGDDEPEIFSPIFWYCFRAFDETGTILCIYDKGEDEIKRISSSFAKSDRMLEIIKTWKGRSSLEYEGLILHRSRTIEGVREFLLESFPSVQERSQRS
ncbi:MAG: hypothetical protein QCI82_10935 [Candidatus Thermoplasmatota archaeon]|nr:hypothetical protein [Candidatus Thermoplasmatota archaeon]